jgi:predicted methyltransferase
MKVLACVVLAVAFLPGCAATGGHDEPLPMDAYRGMLASPLRLDRDKTIDERRHAAELLHFAAVRPGMRVLDVASGGGYTTTLLAVAVGPSGKVYAQTPNPGASLNERVTKNPDAFIVAKRPFDDPVPPEAAPLDLVTLILNYHDITYLPVDRDAMNRKIFAALRPGGHYVIVDHSALAGTGISVGKTLHRIEEAFLVAEVKKAGFVLEREGWFMRNASDNRAETSEPPKLTDKFVLRFVKPR